MSPEVSVIISFYNNINYLKLVLAGYHRQSFKDFEVVIADDGSRKEIVDEINSFKTSYNFPIVHVWHEDIGFRKTIILNKATIASNGEYLIFTDQDCVPHKRFIEDHYKLRRKNLMLGGRRVLLDESITCKLSEKNVKNGYLEKTFFQQLYQQIYGELENALWGIWIKNKFIRKFISYKRKGIKGSNFSLFRSELLKLNGFDERYAKIDIGEDDDLNYRFLQFGGEVRIKINLFVQYHLHHKKSIRDNPENRAIFESVKAEKLSYTPYGITKTK